MDEVRPTQAQVVEYTFKLFELLEEIKIGNTESTITEYIFTTFTCTTGIRMLI